MKHKSHYQIKPLSSFSKLKIQTNVCLLLNFPFFLNSRTVQQYINRTVPLFPCSLNGSLGTVRMSTYSASSMNPMVRGLTRNSSNSWPHDLWCLKCSWSREKSHEFYGFFCCLLVCLFLVEAICFHVNGSVNGCLSLYNRAAVIDR